MKPCPAGCDHGYFDNGTCVSDICEHCEGEGRVESWYDRLPGARGLRRQYHARRYVLDHRIARAKHWRGLVREHKDWKSGRTTTVGAYVHAHRPVLDDEPRLRSLVERELMDQLADHTPLLWRLDEARRAMRGELVSAWEYPTSVAVTNQHADFFERNMVVILAERRRIPKATMVKVEGSLSSGDVADLKRRFW